MQSYNRSAWQQNQGNSQSAVSLWFVRNRGKKKPVFEITSQFQMVFLIGHEKGQCQDTRKQNRKGV